jgi:hypothetical protein
MPKGGVWDMDAIAETRSWRYIVLAAIAVIVVVGLWLWIPGCLSNGDYAPVNALFSGLAFAGLIIAIFLQREELQLQRRELALTREEMQGQKEQLEGQKLQMEIQNFENRFFQMMKVWDELRRDVNYRFIIGELSGEYNNHRRSDSHEESVAIESAVGRIWVEYESSLPIYMRSLYQILRLVDMANIASEKRKFYSNVIRAQITQAELVLLFYNCLSSHGNKKMKPLVEKYSLLKHFDTKDLLGSEHPKSYDPNAFK